VPDTGGTCPGEDGVTVGVEGLVAQMAVRVD